MELRPSLKMGKSKCAKSPISYLTTVPPEFETFKLLLMAVALPYKALGTVKLMIDWLKNFRAELLWKRRKKEGIRELWSALGSSIG